MKGRPDTAALVEQAIAIIGPTAERLLVSRAVIRARSTVARAGKSRINSGHYGAVTEPQRQAAQRAAAAVNRLRMALRGPAMVRNFLEDDGVSDEQLAEWQERYQKEADRPSPSKSVRASNQSKLEAAKAAAVLLRQLELPVTVHRHSPFLKLSALFYGEADANLFHTCRRVKAELDQTTRPNSL